MTCDGCKCDGKPKTEEPCCRCDILAERKARLLDDPVLTLLHEVVMEMAVDWAKARGMQEWYEGRVSGAILAWHVITLDKDVASDLRDAAWGEYAALYRADNREM